MAKRPAFDEEKVATTSIEEVRRLLKYLRLFLAARAGYAAGIPGALGIAPCLTDAAFDQLKNLVEAAVDAWEETVEGVLYGEVLGEVLDPQNSTATLEEMIERLRKLGLPDDRALLEGLVDMLGKPLPQRRRERGAKYIAKHRGRGHLGQRIADASRPVRRQRRPPKDAAVLAHHATIEDQLIAWERAGMSPRMAHYLRLLDVSTVGQMFRTQPPLAGLHLEPQPSSPKEWRSRLLFVVPKAA